MAFNLLVMVSIRKLLMQGGELLLIKKIIAQSKNSQTSVL
jgi:hypothetical protein